MLARDQELESAMRYFLHGVLENVSLPMHERAMPDSNLGILDVMSRAMPDWLSHVWSHGSQNGGQGEGDSRIRNPLGNLPHQVGGKWAVSS